MKHPQKYFWSATVISLSLTIGSIAQAAETYKFGIVPQSNGSRLSKLWTPILQYLESKTGYKLQFATARNIPTFEKRLLAGKYDIAYMNPYHYVQYNALAGYQAFAKAKNKRLKGILVVRKDSPYKSIQDLKSVEMAFPSNAFAANLVPVAIMSRAGQDIAPKYVSSHDSVYRNIAKGRYPAGGGVMRTFNNTPQEYRDNLKILWKSDGYTPHAFASHSRVPQHVIQRLQQVMLQMDQDPEGKVLLKSIRLKGIEPGKDAEWDDVRALNIES